MSDHVRVEFNTIDGVTLRGDFFLAAGDGAPCVVMTQGLTLLKEHYIEDTARRFQAAGISALVYDHRSYGSSDGLPRHETNPSQQALDYHDAVSAAQRLPGVDPARVAVWGIGHSGGAVMMSAGEDPRVKAVILNMPFLSGKLDAMGFPAGVLERAWSDRATKTAAGETEPTYLRVWPDSIEEARGETGEKTFISGEVPWDFISGGVKISSAAGTPWENRITLQSFFHIERVEPRLQAFRIHQPALYLAAQDDPLTGPLQLHVLTHSTMGPNAEFKVLTPHHLATYFGDAFERAISVQLEFLKRAL